jgi:uncharacterized protein YjdB/lysophospholipase L1-like esterase
MKKYIKNILALLLAVSMLTGMVPAYGTVDNQASGSGLISETGAAGDFPLVKDGVAATIWVGGAETRPVQRVVKDFQADVKRITNLEPAISSVADRPQGPVVVVGTLGSAVVGTLNLSVQDKAAIEGKWEAYLIKVVDENTLAIIGSDERGAIFGVYEVSERMGVSPWYYFADVPVQTKTNVYVPAGTSVTDKPDVQYRGIFLNDEEKLSRWVTDVFNKAEGGSGIMGAEIYGKIFELILRMKGNYIWAAMHVNSINNIPANIDAVHEYGIVLGSSHCDILLRTNVHEWDNWVKSKGYNTTTTKYDYTVNPEIVLEYWRENAVRHKDTEAQWTLGMRGKHDEGFDTADIMDSKYDYLGVTSKEDRQAKLLAEIIQKQQEILKEVLGQEKYDKAFLAFIPYKEVLPIYNNSNFTMTDDVTVIWCDDNHGMVRKTPTEAERARAGGSGLYYHVSYWAPADQSYLWMSSLPLSVMGEELNKSWNTGIQKSWILNVGDMKPGEAEMEYFIRCGWDVDKYTGASKEFSADWMARNFGAAMSESTTEEVADILNTFYQHTNVRKVDHMRLDIFEQTNYNEWDKRMAAYQDLYDRTNAVAQTLSATQQTAFYELVQCRINWAYLTNKMFYYADKSILAYDQGRMASADAFSKLSIETELERKAEIAKYSQIAGGKWKGFIDPENHAPPVTTQLPGTNPALVLGDAAMGVVVQGEALPQQSSKLAFSPYNQDGKFIDVFNKGAGSFSWTATADQAWVKLSVVSGIVNDETRLWVTIDDIENHKGGTAIITITGGSVVKTVAVTVENPSAGLNTISGYAEADGYVSMQAEHYTKKNDAGSKIWQTLSNAGRGFDGDMMRAFDPVLEAVDEGSINAENSPSLEYDFTLTSTGAFPLEVYRLPTMNATADGKVRFAVSVDDGAPIVVSSTAVDEGTSSNQNPQWRENLYRQIEKHVLMLPELTAGKHTLKLWMVDNLIAIDKMVIYTVASSAAQIPLSALGPDESYHSTANTGFTSSVPQMERISAPAEPKDLRTQWGTGAFQEANGKVSIEAEYAMENELSSKDQITDDMSAYTVSKWDEAAKFPKGGKLPNKWRLTQSDTGLGMRLPDVGTSWTEAAEFPVYAPELTYKVDFSTLGTYHVWVRWRLVDNSGDSIRAGLNNVYAGGFSSDQMWQYSNDEKWYWQEVGTVKVTSQGAQPFSMWMREDGLYLDRIYLTTGSENPGSGDWQESYRGGSTETDLFKRTLEAKKKEIDGYSYPVGDGVGCYSKTAYNAMMSAIKDAEALAASGNVTEAQGETAIKAIDDAWKALAASQKLTDGSVTYYAYRDFSADEVGRLPYGFTVEAMTNGAAATVQEENGNQFLRLTTSSTSGKANLILPYAGAVTSDASHRVVVEYRARFTGTYQYANGALVINDSASDAFSMAQAFENANQVHEVRIHKGTGGSDKVKVGNFEYGQWHTFKLVGDWANKTYTVYMDNNPTPVAKDFRFRNTGGTKMTGQRFGIDGYSNGMLDFDDFRVSIVEATAITPIAGTVTITGTAQWGQTLTANVTNVTPDAGDSLSYVWTDSDGKQVGTDNTYVPTEADVGKTLTVTVKGTGAYVGSVASVATTAVETADNTQGETLKNFVDTERAKLNGLSIPVGSGLGCYGYDEYAVLMDALDAAEALSALVPTAEAVTAEKAKVGAAWIALSSSLNLRDANGMQYYAYRDFSADENGLFPYGVDTLNKSKGATVAIMEEKGNKFLRLSTTSTDKYANLSLPYSGQLTATADERIIIEVKSRFIAGQFSSIALPYGSNGQQAMFVGFDNASTKHQVSVITYGNKKDSGAFDYGQWHSFTIVADIAATPQTYTVYMDGKQLGYNNNGTLETVYNFRNSVTDLTKHTFGIDNFSNVDVDFDDLKVYVAIPNDILSVAVVPAITAPLGSSIETVKGRLPDKVMVTLGDGTTRDLAVTWACDGAYDPAATTRQTFTGTLTLPEGITNSKNLTATAAVTLTKLRIACVGDSITYGSNGAGGRVDEAERYPNQLQALLNNQYEVGNFGVSGACMVADGSDSGNAVKGYSNLSAYTDSLNYSPDVVVIMLGTNDSKGLNWDNYKNDYVQDALDMIKDYQSLKSNPKIYVATSPTVLAGANTYGIQGNVVHNEIVNLQRQIALAAGAGFIDVHEATKNATTAQFPDLVHGNKDGYAMIASAVKDAITAAETPKASPIQTVDAAQANTVAGYIPEFPFAVVTYENGAKGVASVDWDMAGKKFDTVGEVEINGALTGLSDKTTKLTVTVAEAKLAKAVSATATSRETANPDGNAIDKDLSTRWAASGNSLPQDLVIQLDGIYELDQISIVWYNSDGNRKYQYDVEVSTDGETYTRVVDRSGNGRSGTVTDSMGGVKAQYVKIHATGKSGGSVSIWEVDLFGEKDGGEVTEYAVTYNLTNVTADGAPAKVQKGAPLEATLTAEPGYDLPETISVTMGGQLLTAGTGYTYNKTGGKVNIVAVTGAVELTAVGEKQPTDPTYYTVTVNNGTGGGNGFKEADLVTVTATVPEGKQFVEWTSTDVALTAEQKAANPMTFTMPAKNVTVSATVEDIPVPADKEVVSVEKLDGMNVPYGTEEANLGLPATVEVTLDDDSKTDLAVTWTCAAGYDAETEGSYTFSGALTLTTGIANTAGETAEITVTVEAQVTEEKNIVSVAEVTDRTVTYGTTKDNAVDAFPKFLRVTLDDQSTSTVSVTWTCETYDGELAGEYTFEGILTETGGIKNPENLKAIAKVIVKEEETTVIPVTGVTLNHTTSTIYTNTTPRSVQLVATVAPADASNKTVTWMSDNPLVARVDADGLVTAVSSGSTTITVTTEDGGHTATCTVTVTVTTDGPSFIPDNTTTTTEKNEDGSTTTTVTNKTTGTVTKTTTYPNGDKTVMETKKDGTVIEKVTKKDGYQSETVTKPNGSFTSKVTDTDGVKTETTATAEGEITADVKLPEKVERAKVTVPVKGATPGMVAVIIHKDGTEELIRTSVTDENGVSFIATENVKVKLVDNASSFNDVTENHWAADAIAFATSRELFLGADEGTFAPEMSMSRAMLVTVMARLDGEVTEGGATWYSKAMDWAVEAAISDGSAPEAAINREQLAVMLYRYAGKPAAEGEGKSFTDSGDVSAWASEAMDWAVKTGILTGKAGNRLDPTGLASRAEVSAMLMRFVEQINKA